MRLWVAALVLVLHGTVAFVPTQRRSVQRVARRAEDTDTEKTKARLRRALLGGSRRNLGRPWPGSAPAKAKTQTKTQNNPESMSETRVPGFRGKVAKLITKLVGWLPGRARLYFVVAAAFTARFLMGAPGRLIVSQFQPS